MLRERIWLGSLLDPLSTNSGYPVQLNFDVSWTGLGFCIRDHNGLIVAAGSSTATFLSACVTELLREVGYGLVVAKVEFLYGINPSLFLSIYSFRSRPGKKIIG